MANTTIERAYREDMGREENIYRRINESVPEDVSNRHNKSVKRKALVA
jgi:hypothetical protein